SRPPARSWRTPASRATSWLPHSPRRTTSSRRPRRPSPSSRTRSRRRGRAPTTSGPSPANERSSRTRIRATSSRRSSTPATRRTQLLDQANQTDHDVVKKLAAVNDLLRGQRSDLAQQEQQQQALRDTLHDKLAAVQQQQAETSQLVSALQTRLDTQIAIVA